MAIELKNLPRVFEFDKDGDKVTLSDPNPELTVEEVVRFYSGQHPELTTCTVTGPTVDKDQAVYSFKTTVGTKG